MATTYRRDLNIRSTNFVVFAEPNLVEDCSKLFQGKDSKCVGCDGHNTFGALLGGEAGGVFKQFIGEGCEVEA